MGGLYTFLYPALLVVLFRLTFLSVCFFLVCFLGVVQICHSLWQGDFTHNHKQVLNRLKIPQGLSTLLFLWWSEVPSRGEVRGDSLYKKLPALQSCHFSVFSVCCFLELLSLAFFYQNSSSSVLSDFVVLFSIL